MLKDFLKEIVVLIVGKPAEPLADLLNSNKYVNEFIIAKKLGITINQTRNMLYKISDKGLVSSVRKKDKRKGWYTYFWKLEVLKALEFLRDILLKKIEQVNGQIKSREMKQFYLCEKCHVEYTEENALIHDFICPECGNLLIIKDNTSTVKELKKNWAKLNKELSDIEEQIKLEKDKVLKVREKEIRKLNKMKKAKRAFIMKKKASKKTSKKISKAKKKRTKKITSKKKPKKTTDKKIKKVIHKKKTLKVAHKKKIKKPTKKVSKKKVRKKSKKRR